MFRRLLMTCAVLVGLLGASGCGMPVAPINLIKPPVSEGIVPQDKWDAILKDLLPEGARLLTSAHDLSFGDLDGDGTDEAIVVYEENVNHGKVLKAALVMKQNEKWRIVWDTKGFGYDLDYAGVADVNKDGHPEILLGWSLGGGQNGLDIYEWGNNTLNLRLKKGYQGHFNIESLDLN